MDTIAVFFKKLKFADADFTQTSPIDPDNVPNRLVIYLSDQICDVCPCVPSFGFHHLLQKRENCKSLQKLGLCARVGLVRRQGSGVGAENVAPSLPGIDKRIPKRTASEGVHEKMWPLLSPTSTKCPIFCEGREPLTVKVTKIFSCALSEAVLLGMRLSIPGRLGATFSAPTPLPCLRTNATRARRPNFCSDLHFSRF